MQNEKFFMTIQSIPSSVAEDRLIHNHKTALIKNKLEDHLKKLQALAESKQWMHLQLHTDHPDSGFDWWMFPIDRASTHYGDQYQVTQCEIEMLKNDASFMKCYRLGVILVAKSWGWDLEQRKDAANRLQKWAHYQIRLGKMVASLKLFKQDDLRSAITEIIDQKNLRHSLEPWIQQLLTDHDSYKK